MGRGDIRYVTVNGEILEADGVLRAGPLTAAMGLLSRRSELEVISQQIAEVDGRIEQLGRELAEGSTQARSLEEDISSLRNAVYQSNTAKVEWNSAAAQNADRQNALKREQPVVDRELQSLAAQMQRLESEQNSLAAQRSQMEADQSAANCAVETLTGQQTKIAEQLRELGEQLTGLRVHLGQVQEKQLACQQSVQRQTAAQAELGQQMERVEHAVSGGGVAPGGRAAPASNGGARGGDAHRRRRGRRAEIGRPGRANRRGGETGRANCRPRWKNRASSARESSRSCTIWKSKPAKCACGSRPWCSARWRNRNWTCRRVMRN